MAAKDKYYQRLMQRYKAGDEKAILQIIKIREKSRERERARRRENLNINSVDKEKAELRWKFAIARLDEVTQKLNEEGYSDELYSQVQDARQRVYFARKNYVVHFGSQFDKQEFEADYGEQINFIKS